MNGQQDCAHCVHGFISMFSTYSENIPLVPSSNPEEISKGQVSPQEIFDFIEQELIESISLLPKKEGIGGNKLKQGQWNKGWCCSFAD